MKYLAGLLQAVKGKASREHGQDTISRVPELETDVIGLIASCCTLPSLKALSRVSKAVRQRCVSAADSLYHDYIDRRFDSCLTCIMQSSWTSGRLRAAFSKERIAMCAFCDSMAKNLCNC